MTKALDFNSVNRPTLDLTMKDEAKTLIRVSIPKQKLIEELQTVSGELSGIINGGQTADSLHAVFDLAARLISCNRDFIQVTAEDLQVKYGMDLEDLILFFGVYMDFITDISKAKN